MATSSLVSLPQAVRMIESLQQQMDGVVQRQKVPPGTVWAFAGVNAPQGWLVCDGSAIGRQNPLYSDLFQAIGTTYNGVGDNVTTFNLPNLQGRVIVGSGQGAHPLTSRNLGTFGGEETHQL